MSDISTEVYGFVSWIVSFVAYGMYLIWALVPDCTLNALGITYYPSKYWALALPAFSIVCTAFVVCIYNALNFLATPSLTSSDLIEDDHSRESHEHDDNDNGYTIPAVSDIPIGVVNQVLYRRSELDCTICKCSNKRLVGHRHV